MLADGERVTGVSEGFFWNFYTREVDLHLRTGRGTRVIPARTLRRVARRIASTRGAADVE